MAEQKKLKASERLTILEQQLLTVMSTLNATAKRLGEMELIQYSVSRESELLRNAVSLLNEKLSAVIDLSNNKSDLSDENIDKIIIAKKIQALENIVTEQLELGAIVKSEEVIETSFVVGREIDKDGVVKNPRIQFMVNKITGDIKESIMGMKIGELLKTEKEDNLNVEITEIYNIVQKEEAVTEELLPEEEVIETTEE